jgi:protein involved in ribonucleotide reduction
LPFARDFAPIKNVPNWNDWAIRLAGAYDLFGTGKTALKGNVSKYMASEAAAYAATFNPMGLSAETRRWTDLDNNLTIYDANGNIQYNEVAAGSANFGQAGATPTPDPGLKRGYNWEYSVSLQHELMPKVSITGGYYRRVFGNLRINDNRNLSPTTDWNPFVIVGPSDDRFPTGGGETITMYSLNPTASRTSDFLTTFSTANNNIYNGVEFSGNARFGKGFFFAGITTERRETLGCDGSTSTTTSPRDNPNGPASATTSRRSARRSRARQPTRCRGTSR